MALFLFISCNATSYCLRYEILPGILFSKHIDKKALSGTAKKKKPASHDNGVK